MSIYNNTTDPAKSYTIEEFIELGANDTLSFTNFVLLEKLDAGLIIHTKNLIFDYMDELKSLAVDVTVSNKEYLEYIYRPKKLSYKLYGSTELYFAIMALNDIIDIRDFMPKGKIKLIPKSDLIDVLSNIYNANYNLITINKTTVE